MNEHDERTPCSAMDSRSSLQSLATGTQKTTIASEIASDRLYQVAALTAGIVLLITLI